MDKVDHYARSMSHLFSGIVFNDVEIEEAERKYAHMLMEYITSSYFNPKWFESGCYYDPQTHSLTVRYRERMEEIESFT